MSNKDLYFIPILARAFDDTDNPEAFTEAVAEIVRLGRNKEYQSGYQQFERFVGAGIEALSGDPDRLNELREQVLEKAIIDLATDTFSGQADVRAKLLNAIEKQPELKAKYDKLRKELKPYLDDEIPLEFEIEKDGKIIGALRFAEDDRHRTLENITPGFYRVLLASGMLLWEGEVTRDQLIWTAAFPGKKLDLAADTGEGELGITRTISLFEGELSLSIGAGLESGWMMLSKQKP